MKTCLTFVSCLILFGATQAFAETSSMGRITSLEVSTAGLIFQLDNGQKLPPDCAHASGNRFKVDVKHNALISAVLASWMSGKTSVIVWSEPRSEAVFCPVVRIELLK